MKGGGASFQNKMKRYFLNSIWLSFTLVICITLKKNLFKYEMEKFWIYSCDLFRKCLLLQNLKIWPVSEIITINSIKY